MVATSTDENDEKNEKDKVSKRSKGSQGSKLRLDCFCCLLHYCCIAANAAQVPYRGHDAPGKKCVFFPTNVPRPSEPSLTIIRIRTAAAKTTIPSTTFPHV
eukprot:TRINITY_DN2208_c0_g1_i2.p2 TRINITY_DN2208_c0_g1~~TRINITY_DN2208_c0_g1_i2.p2  ORF type:complete len:108 (-),score=4.99 TRINITY_DN2208_c0_g1_i2:291-593(-)